MGLDIWFAEDISNALLALDQASERLSGLAERYGMNPEAARLCHEVYNGALGDVAASFGLVLSKLPPKELVGTVQIPAWAEEQDAALPRSDAAAWER